MENFQLYRTNLLLGGQMKWDMVLDSGNGSLYVSDFHLSPISPNIPYTYSSDENLLNNTHQDNIKAYYKKLQGHFYNDGLDAQFLHNYPMVVSDGDIPTTYSNIYDMGCKRTKHYRLYEKQLEFFCPVWLEKLDGVLSFEVSLYSFGSDIPMGTRTLKLDLTNYESHNKFVTYFKKYITYTQIDKGNDKLLNISFNRNKAYVTGVNAKTGNYITKDISTIVPNLTSRERPLMEFDNLLLGNFVNNNIICNNLFNFNLCLNLEDLASASIAKMLLGKELTIKVRVLIDDEELELRDFYTEYDYIAREVFDGYGVINSVTTPNIEDILVDTKPTPEEPPTLIAKECPNCNTSVPIKTDTCPTCGYDFQTGSMPELEIKICPNCGTINSKDAVKCSSCRTLLVSFKPQVKKCPHCNTTCDIDATTCSNCGYWFDDVTIPPIEDEPVTGKECPECGAICEENASVCKICGYSFKQIAPDIGIVEKPTTITCPTCFTVNDGNAAICSNCGRILTNISDSRPSVTFSLRRTTEPEIETNPDITEDDFNTKVESTVYMTKFNVFEHLQDNKYLDFVNKNKFSQNICHWSLVGYNDYIFNLYRGFDGLYIDLETGLTYENEHQYGATPDLNSTKFIPQQNSCGWFNTTNVDIWSSLYLYTIDETLIKKQGTQIDNRTYINNIKYNNNYKGEPFYVLGVITTTRNLGVFASSVNCRKLESKYGVYAFEKGDNLMIVTDKIDEFTYLALSETLRKTENLDGNLKSFYELMRAKISPSLVRFNGILNWKNATGPTYDIDEIEYYKNDNDSDYVFRYDGSIKPTFVKDLCQTLYYKDFVSDNRSNGKSKLQLSVYSQYINTGYEPLYPSIKYCSIKKNRTWSYNTLPNISVTENNNQPLSKYDYAWFNDGKYLHLQNKIKFEYINSPDTNGVYKTLPEIVFDYLKDMYGCSDEITKYIQSKYIVKNDWEYFSDTNVTDYVYKIELTLK